MRSREDEPAVVTVARISARANRAALCLAPIASVEVLLLQRGTRAEPSVQRTARQARVHQVQCFGRVSVIPVAVTTSGGSCEFPNSHIVNLDHAVGGFP